MAGKKEKRIAEEENMRWWDGGMGQKGIESMMTGWREEGRSEGEKRGKRKRRRHHNLNYNKHQYQAVTL
jgi:hypothetical protein